MDGNSYGESDVKGITMENVNGKWMDSYANVNLMLIRNAYANVKRRM